MAIVTAKNLLPSRSHVDCDAVTPKYGMSRVIVAAHYLAMPFSTRQRSQFLRPWQWHYDGADNFGPSAIRAGRSERCLEDPGC